MMMMMMMMMMVVVVRAKNTVVQNVLTLSQHYPTNSVVLPAPYIRTQSYYPGNGSHEAMPC